MRLLYIYSSVLVLSVLVSCKTSKNAGNPQTGISQSALGNKKKTGDKQLTESERLEYDKTFFNANKEQMLGNMELAANLFNQCMKLDPANAAAIYELAKIYNVNGNKDKALELSAKAANLDLTNTWYQLLYADILFTNKQYLQGTEIYKRIIKINPGKIDMYFELAEGYVFANKPEEAIKVYDEVEEKIGVNEEGSMQKVKVYTQLKKTDRALKELNKLILLKPKEPK
jgi:tetratricopeptide (TPR) repeat protein